MMNKLVIVIHIIFVVLAYSAWLWLDYKILAVLAIAHLVMLEALRGCPLSHFQFPDDKDKRFYEWWMGKLGIKLDTVKRRSVMRVFMQYLLPFIIIGLAIILQVVIGLHPVVYLPF